MVFFSGSVQLLLQKENALLVYFLFLTLQFFLIIHVWLQTRDPPILPPFSAILKGNIETYLRL